MSSSRSPDETQLVEQIARWLADDAERCRFAKGALLAWISAWDDVRGWRFEADYSLHRELLEVRSERMLGDQIWRSVDAIPRIELESAVSVEIMIGERAKARQRVFEETAVAMEERAYA